MHDLLHKVGHGHLGCSLEGHPYVVPMHYYFEEPNIYILTTVGMKTKYIDANPEVCLQVEEVHNLKHWRSVTVTGRAEHITLQQDIDRVMQFVKTQNPTLSPAINRTWQWLMLLLCPPLILMADELRKQIVHRIGDRSLSA